MHRSSSAIADTMTMTAVADRINPFCNPYIVLRKEIHVIFI
ncbi:MAG TPA: hypothetical protein VGU64_06085 [Terriglobales bacterium]|nr:hypothetical protein [Terriglobales bacterium]